MTERKNLLGKLLAFCFPDPIKKLVDDEALADTIRGEQMRSLIRTSPALIAVTGMGVVLTGYVLFSTAHLTVLFGWVACGLLLVFAGAVNTRKFDGKELELRPTKSTFKAVYNAALLAFLWATLPLLFFEGATPAQQIFITCVIAGMMGGGAIALSMLPVAAGTMCIVIGFGAMVTMLRTGEPILILACVMLINYIFAIMLTVRSQGEKYVQSLVDQRNIKQSGETIGLLLKDFQNNSSDWIWETNTDGYFVEMSERFIEVSGRDHATLAKTHISQLIRDVPPSERRRGTVASPAGASIMFEKRRAFKEVIFSVLVNEKVRWWVCSGHPIFDANGAFAGFRGVASDISKRKEAEMKLAHLARYDHLTGLANRSEFTEHIRHEIGALDTSPHVLAVLYLDLDKFKSINDSLGHGVGDNVLIEAADRIKQQVGEAGLAARLGGDEFAVVLRCNDGIEDAVGLSERILAALKVPMEIAGHSMKLSTSVGVAMSNNPSDLAETVLHNADLALYRAKAEGRGIYKLFAKDMDLAMRERRELEIELRSAVSENQLELHYQPLADIRSGDVIGFEALIRWNNPKRGIVNPDTFIGLAEDTGLIHEIGDWVIGQACRDAKLWPGMHKVAVNLSANQLQSYRLVQRVIEALSETGLPAQRLELEVTESVLINDPDMALKLLTNLRDLGVKISLDDFGTGYSSLAYLVQFPFDKLKIDKSFVQGANQSPENLAILRSILGLARSLKIATLAEGVETAEHIELLREEGCEQIQGMLLDAPKPFSDVKNFDRYPISAAETVNVEIRKNVHRLQSRLDRMMSKDKVA